MSPAGILLIIRLIPNDLMEDSVPKLHATNVSRAVALVRSLCLLI